MLEKILSLHPNRAALTRHLGSHINRAHAHSTQVGLLVVRVKRGQEFSALYGHQTAETLLEQLAARLDAICRKDDRILRIGDYLYALILPQILNEGHAILAANKILRIMSTPFDVDNQSIAVGVTMGIALFPEHAGKPETLLQHAELALANAAHGDLPYLVYNDHTPQRIADGWDIESELDTALDNGELEIHYQPKINLRGGLLTGAEALLRWRSPTRGLVPPNVFIPVASRTGQLKALTWSTLNMALENAASWPTRFGPLTLAINIAPTLLSDESLVNRVADAMAMWHAKPNRVILEITESAVMSNPEVSFETIRDLKAHGIAVSIDDFGTGYSSLANFKNIPATELKIDTSFIRSMLTSKADANIVRAIIGLAQSFDIRVAAEGAENIETLRALAAMQCDYAQGYYISPPVPAGEFVRFIQEYVPPVF